MKLGSGILTGALVAVLTATASAAPVSSIGNGVDVNFKFSVIHTASSGFDGQGGTILYDAITLNSSLGLVSTFDVGIVDGASPSGLADIADMYLDVKRKSDGLIGTFHVTGKFDSVDLADGLFDPNFMVGYLRFDHAAGVNFLNASGATDLDGKIFLFEDRSYSSATLKPNGRIGDTVTLWGQTVFTGLVNGLVLGDAMDLVATDVGRGIDLRINLEPIPEPATLALVGLGAAAIGWRRRRRASA